LILDIFNHFMPAAYFERLRQLVPDHPAATAFPKLATLWDLDARLKLLAQFGDYARCVARQSAARIAGAARAHRGAGAPRQ
jgi:aminocarboxymuconate-semialdehyde decarboxylase